MSKTNWDETLYKFGYVRFGKYDDDDDDDDEESVDDEYVVVTSYSATADEPVNESITNEQINEHITNEPVNESIINESLNEHITNEYLQISDVGKKECINHYFYMLRYFSRLNKLKFFSHKF